MDRNQEEAPLLIAQSGPLKGNRWILNRPLTIGRDVTCDIVIADRMVSRFHARLNPEDSGVSLEDLGSKNGTYRNGQLLTGPVLLQDGDIIQIALAQELMFLTSDATVPLPDSPVESGGLRLDPRSRSVWIHDILLDPPLSLLQFEVLKALYERQGQVVPRQELVEACWGKEQAIGVSDQALDALLRRLRERLAEIDPHHVYIVTVRGHGIKLQNRPEG
jgi:DNA-binding winged helix-turn-helix (wHTH) protein